MPRTLASSFRALCLEIFLDAPQDLARLLLAFFNWAAEDLPRLQSFTLSVASAKAERRAGAYKPLILAVPFAPGEAQLQQGTFKAAHLQECQPRTYPWNTQQTSFVDQCGSLFGCSPGERSSLPAFGRLGNAHPARAAASQPLHEADCHPNRAGSKRLPTSHGRLRT